jgi:hypothetical protein
VLCCRPAWNRTIEPLGRIRKRFFMPLCDLAVWALRRCIIIVIVAIVVVEIVEIVVPVDDTEPAPAQKLLGREYMLFNSSDPLLLLMLLLLWWRPWRNSDVQQRPSHCAAAKLMVVAGNQGRRVEELVDLAGVFPRRVGAR